MSARTRSGSAARPADAHARYPDTLQDRLELGTVVPLTGGGNSWATARTSTAGWSRRTASALMRPLLPGEENDNAAHRKVRARVEHVIGRMKNCKILRDCRQRGDGLHHAVQAVAHLHNLALASCPEDRDHRH